MPLPYDPVGRKGESAIPAMPVQRNMLSPGAEITRGLPRGQVEQGDLVTGEGGKASLLDGADVGQRAPIR